MPNLAVINGRLINGTSAAPREPGFVVFVTNPGFASNIGDADPDPVVRAITNAAGGSFVSVVATVHYTAGELTGWLNAAMALVSGLWQVTLTATKGALPAEFYHATVELTAPSDPGVLPVTIPVTMQVQPISTSGIVRASSRRADDSVILGRGPKYFVDEPAVVAMNEDTGDYQVRQPVSSPLEVIVTMIDNGKVTFDTFTVFPANYFGGTGLVDTA